MLYASTLLHAYGWSGHHAQSTYYLTEYTIVANLYRFRKYKEVTDYLEVSADTPVSNIYIRSIPYRVALLSYVAKYPIIDRLKFRLNSILVGF